MDKINVLDEALKKSALALQQLEEQASVISSDCIQQIVAQLLEIETEFKKDIIRYIEDIKAINDKLKICADENVSALCERLANLTEYNTHIYKRRNIG